MKKDNEQKKLIFLFLGAFFIMIFIMIFAHKVDAAEPEDPSYPMIIDFAKNPEDTSLEEIQNAFSIMWGDLPDSYILYCSGHDQRYLNGSHGWDYYDTFTYTISVNPVFEYPLELSVTSPYYYITNGVEYYFAYIPDLDHWGSYNTATNIRHQFAYSYMAQGLGWLLYGTEDEYTSTDNIVVWAHEHSSPVIVTGHATPPHPLITPFYTEGDTPPSSVPPSYTINNYTWTTAPSFDNSSVINGIQSIKNTLDWLGENIRNSISNILTNIKGIAEYIGKTVQYYGNAIIETLNNAIQNFYNNMKSLVEPIYSKLESLYNDFKDFADLFIHPFDQEEYEEQIDNCILITRYNELLDNCEVIQQIFDETSEPDSFILYIDFENPFADSEHKIIKSEINFNWLVPLRPVYRPFLTVFTLIECFVGGFRILGNIIGGKAK